MNTFIVLKNEMRKKWEVYTHASSHYHLIAANLTKKKAEYLAQILNSLIKDYQ